MRIGIDIDGVLTNIEQWQLDNATKYYFEKYGKEISNYKGYDTAEIFNVPIEQDNEWWFKGIQEYMKEPARKYADEVIKKLRDGGNEIYIITARSSDLSYTNITTEEMQNNVKIWLNNNHIVYDKIIFSQEEKLHVCEENKIDLMIEDKPSNIIKLSNEIPVISFYAKYNEECIGKNIIQCYSWYDIYAKILKMQNDA